MSDGTQISLAGILRWKQRKPEQNQSSWAMCRLHHQWKQWCVTYRRNCTWSDYWRFWKTCLSLDHVVRGLLSGQSGLPTIWARQSIQLKTLCTTTLARGFFRLLCFTCCTSHRKKHIAATPTWHKSTHSLGTKSIRCACSWSDVLWNIIKTGKNVSFTLTRFTFLILQNFKQTLDKLPFCAKCRRPE